ncbi:MAG TPA: vitamin B12-dependent ribonucleotide reductase [Dehalococcoidales bacterium]|nr:vitamin B12-dependent ribonucleotide reductase [Dehalococcoidales bacterium]
MPVNRTQIARAIFSAAESMGISDREKIERIVDQVIERTEPRSLPGMEGLISDAKGKMKFTPSVSEIQNMVKEILAEEEQAELKNLKKEQPEMETTLTKPEIKVLSQAKPVVKDSGGLALTENALHVLEKRYLKKDKNGHPVETPVELFRRVARTIAAADLKYNPKADVKAREEEFYRVMTSLEFLPNSPTLMNAGRELGQLSACFVLPVGDSMEEIFDSVKYTALIHKSGGGTGFSFSRLRPHQDRVGSTGGVASGPVSFIRAFDTATDVIKQGGMRRGANMGILNVDHPDIEAFIDAKKDLTALTNFNLSVAITSEFMEAVKTGSDYNLVNPHNKEVTGKLNAKKIFEKIVDGAWKTGDPGIVFIDRINKDNPTPQLGKIESTNPCGEQPLLPFESCNLGSINLARMLKKSAKKWELDWPKLARTIHLAVRFLDNVIDVNKFPLPQIEARTLETRKIGLGVMGFADMLMQIGVAYNSEEGLKTAEDVMRFINDEAFKASLELGAERGVFPAFTGSIYDKAGGPRVRNAARTTIAPTGTLSIIASCSGGIEPVFALSFTKNILDGAQLVEVNPYFEETAKRGGFYSAELMQKLAEGTHISDIPGIPEDTKKIFVTAHEISPEFHVKMQAAFQKHTDNAVSKTVNFPRTATREDVAKVYLMAYENGLKGITIYRDGSREGQVLTTGKEKKAEAKAVEQSPTARTPRQRAKITTGITEKVTTGCGNIYITVNSDDHGICEVFSHLGKAGGCAVAQLEATCRLISLALRSGVDVESVAKQLRGIRCPSIAWENGKSVLSCADAISSVLEKYTEAGKAAVAAQSKGNGHTAGSQGGNIQDFGLVKNTAGQCPECANLLVYQEGCFVCPGCGYTKC